MSPTHQDLSNDTTFSRIKSCVPVPLKLNLHVPTAQNLQQGSLPCLLQGGAEKNCLPEKCYGRIFLKILSKVYSDGTFSEKGQIFVKIRISEILWKDPATPEWGHSIRHSSLNGDICICWCTHAHTSLHFGRGGGGERTTQRDPFPTANRSLR